MANEEFEEVLYWKGHPIGGLTREELERAMRQLYKLYRTVTAEHMRQLDILAEFRRAGVNPVNTQQHKAKEG